MKTTQIAKAARNGAKPSIVRTKTAGKRKAPVKYKPLEFKPLPPDGGDGPPYVNLATEFMRIGQSVGGVKLELPPRGKG